MESDGVKWQLCLYTQLERLEMDASAHTWVPLHHVIFTRLDIEN